MASQHVTFRCGSDSEWQKKRVKLTDITQDGTNKGRLNDTEFAFHKREDL